MARARGGCMAPCAPRCGAHTGGAGGTRTSRSGDAYVSTVALSVSTYLLLLSTEYVTLQLYAVKLYYAAQYYSRNPTSYVGVLQLQLPQETKKCIITGSEKPHHALPRCRTGDRQGPTRRVDDASP